MSEQLRQEFWKWSQDDQRRFDFYRQFVATDTLVFDIGANVGNRSKVFSRLGATVIAVEPQEVCSRLLEVVFSGTPQFYLIESALGASAMEAEMLICDAHTISSLSPAWIHAVKQSGRFAGYNWSRNAVVRVDTLDNLISQFGIPDFIKIDVEGFEDQVLLGLTAPVRALSLEFVPEYLQSTFDCIDHLSRLGSCHFQLSLGESMEFSLLEWVAADDIKTALSRVSFAEFGDVYARFA